MEQTFDQDRSTGVINSSNMFSLGVTKGNLMGVNEVRNNFEGHPDEYILDPETVRPLHHE